ncbi:hypothetical protein PSR59_02475 [Ligilactobacillus ruminis]|uniref:Uncharacterized protein n=1 Tax=Ligilactobacillus ruminis TaxID=1623 RepID=A0AAQ2XIH9_9LACO|nr:hypothetical protein [Ligilactobacillus ruminis]WDC82518.1 hypothetical protein PSR59_02475 [Ligilactobacillus ruminis]
MTEQKQIIKFKFGVSLTKKRLGKLCLKFKTRTIHIIFYESYAFLL